MKGQYYRIDWDTCDSLHLYGREAMVYCALIYLCKRTPYKGSATELAEFSKCGTKYSALRMLKVLREKGLISVEKEGIRLLQNATASVQNATASVQNATISKAKESTKEKEKIIKEIKDNSSSLTREKKEETASPKDILIKNLFNMDTLIPIDKPKIPATTGYYKIIVLEYGYMKPKKFVDEFYHYWDGKGWPERGNKLSLMRSWMDLYKQKHPKQQPNLNETERLVMKTFLNNIEERLIVRLFNVLRGFEVTEQKIMFYVPKENAQDFLKWLNTMEINKIFEAYNRQIRVRPVQ